MKSLKPILLTLTCSVLTLTCSTLRADPLDYVILNVPEESPGAPWYADFSRGFIPTDGTDVSIVFWRNPADVPADFNLLDYFDIPRAWSTPILLRGQEWWVDEPLTPGNQMRTRMVNDGPVPVYFVALDELEAEIADDVLTIGELEAFSSLRVGYATDVRYDTRNGLRPGEGNDGARYTALGELEGGGRFFVRLFENLDRETGISSVDAVIRFPESQ